MRLARAAAGYTGSTRRSSCSLSRVPRITTAGRVSLAPSPVRGNSSTTSSTELSPGVVAASPEEESVGALLVCAACVAEPAACAGVEGELLPSSQIRRNNSSTEAPPAKYKLRWLVRLRPFAAAAGRCGHSLPFAAFTGTGPAG